MFSTWEVPRPEAFQMDSFISRVSSSSDEMTIHGGSDANPDPCPSFEAGSSAACCPSLVTPGPLQRRLSVNYAAKLARAAKPKANCGPEDSDGSNRGGDKDKGKPAGLVRTISAKLARGSLDPCQAPGMDTAEAEIWVGLSPAKEVGVLLLNRV